VRRNSCGWAWYSSATKKPGRFLITALSEDSGRGTLGGPTANARPVTASRAGWTLRRDAFAPWMGEVVGALTASSPPGLSNRRLIRRLCWTLGDGDRRMLTAPSGGRR